MIEPKRPTMPRNSTLLRFFTVYSWHTLEMAYRVALTRTRPSPRRMSLAVVDTGMNNGYGLTYITFYAIFKYVLENQLASHKIPGPGQQGYPLPPWLPPQPDIYIQLCSE